jgi:hypothetical protein
MHRKIRTQSPYQIERHATMAQLDALEKDWSELVDEIPDVPIFFTWEWIKIWWQYFSQGRQLWVLTARDEQGRLQGIAPFMREEYKKGLVKLGMLAFIGTGWVCPTHLKILARTSDKEGLYRAFLDFLMDQSEQWDILRISCVIPDSIEDNLLMAVGGRIQIGAQVPSPYTHLPSTWEAYRMSLSKRFRHKIKLSKSRLEGDYPGEVDFACVTDSQGLNSAMDKLVEFIRNRCHAKGVFTNWDDPTFTDFHRTIAHLALSRGWLRLYTLTVKGRVISLEYSFRFKDCAYTYNAGYDFDWSQYNPGYLLLAYSIQTAIQEGASEVDMGRGDADYKFFLTDRVRVENEVLFSSNWRGDLWIKLGNFKRGLKNKNQAGDIMANDEEVV